MPSSGPDWGICRDPVSGVCRSGGYPAVKARAVLPAWGPGWTVLVPERAAARVPAGGQAPAWVQARGWAPDPVPVRDRTGIRSRLDAPSVAVVLGPQNLGSQAPGNAAGELAGIPAAAQVVNGKVVRIGRIRELVFAAARGFGTGRQ